jgi:hypothetical protein
MQDPPGPSSPKLSLKPYQGLDDFTRHVSRTTDSENLRFLDGLLAAAPHKKGEKVHSVNETITLPSDFRTLICSCFAGEQYSLTLRKGKTESPSQGWEQNQPPASAATNPSGYAIPPSTPKTPFLFSMHDYVDTLFRAIFGEEQSFAKMTGMVLVGGSTASGKSNITRGLIDRYLIEVKRTKDKAKDRRPHLITFEDPIEVRYFENPELAAQTGVDYTPRQKGVDVANLRCLLQDCLRQTPEAVYVGETRELKDWGELVHFAGTGHLVFTTCHAGSLTEMIGTLLKAVKAETAAGRSVLAGRLLAAIHLRPTKVQANDKTGEAILPGLWLRRPAGVNALTSDGLAAILPGLFPSSSKGMNEKTGYCFGRAYFAARLAKNATDPPMDDLAFRAIQFDLEGL